MDLYLCNGRDFGGISDRISLDSWKTVMQIIKRQIKYKKIGARGEGGGGEWLWDQLKNKHYHDLSICITFSL